MYALLFLPTSCYVSRLFDSIACPHKEKRTLHRRLSMSFDAALSKVLEVLEFSGVPSVKDGLTRANILLYTDFIGAKTRIEGNQVSKLPDWATEPLLTAIAWHDNFREVNQRNPDVLVDLTVSSLKAFKTEQLLCRLIPEYKVLLNSQSPENIAMAADIHAQIRDIKNGISRMVQIDADNIMRRLPDRVSRRLRGMIETEKLVKLVVECIRSEPDVALAETLKKVVIMGRTQGAIVRVTLCVRVMCPFLLLDLSHSIYLNSNLHTISWEVGSEGYSYCGFGALRISSYRPHKRQCREGRSI